MEEIYIIRLKGLPTSSQESLRDNKASFYYRKDLTGEALLGFGTLHSFIGSTLIVLSIINMSLHANTSQILGSGVWCGSIFAIAGLMGIVTAQKRKTDISKSKIQVKIFFTLSIVTLLLTSTYLILLIFDMKEPNANQYIGSNILISFIFELFTSLLSVFTCIRIIWPGSISCCAKDWPMQPKLKRKVIVSTQIYTNGVKQDEDLIRNLGPNCVISLSPPQSTSITRSDNYSTSNDYNEFVSMCECCEHQFNNRSNYDYKSNECNHNLKNNSSECETHERYDSDFDAENFDSSVEPEISYSGREESKEMELEINQNIDSIDSYDENDSKYETIGPKESTLEKDLNIEETFDDCEESQDNEEVVCESFCEQLTETNSENSKEHSVKAF